jgi:hypothetical protein
MKLGSKINLLQWALHLVAGPAVQAGQVGQVGQIPDPEDPDCLDLAKVLQHHQGPLYCKDRFKWLAEYGSKIKLTLGPDELGVFWKKTKPFDPIFAFQMLNYTPIDPINIYIYVTYMLHTYCIYVHRIS